MMMMIVSDNDDDSQFAKTRACEWKLTTPGAICKETRSHFPQKVRARFSSLSWYCCCLCSSLPIFFAQGVLADKVILRHLGPGLITQDLVVYQVNQSFLDAHHVTHVNNFLESGYMLLKGTISYLLLFQGQFSFKYSDPVCYPSNSSTAGQWCLWLYYIVQMVPMHWMLDFMIFLDSGVCNHVKAHFM